MFQGLATSTPTRLDLEFRRSNHSRQAEFEFRAKAGTSITWHLRSNRQSVATPTSQPLMGSCSLIGAELTLVLGHSHPDPGTHGP
ncbi:hypothetical protein N7539_000903 [Penicillium diatomitis]|uniref:Uncharacterized protein n=1 Tax=Penicillium diatomitis TaxID=2819901 RepID=A0A9X0C2N5_9EURO|nr:uncharacterized protein N7539_000903 [Penicillium diatomitis]KAJ5495787.1 hypothetical protein N7539_000903 [Penicillium diatomitis]